MNFKNLGTGAVIGLGCFALVFVILLHVLAIPLGILFVVNAIWGISLSYWVVLVAWWILIILFNLIRGNR